MKISIFGLGYVGTVSAACLAKEGHNVIGVDPVSQKVTLINQGKSPIIETHLEKLLLEAVGNKRLTATTSADKAVYESELSLICVGTPSQPNGNLDVSHIKRVCEHIGTAMQNKDSYHVVVIRSTVLPGTIRQIVIPALELFSKKKVGQDFGVCSNPEFLREGTAVEDFYHPPKTVIGESDQKSGDLMASVYEQMNLPVIRTDIEVAEMVKYVDNVWHALKISFGNEIGQVCKSLNVDSHEVMDIFCADTKLNISPAYLKPGFAFGGSCLPKDVRALAYKTRSLDMDLPILNAILPSNDKQIQKALNLIMESGYRKIGVFGFSFKEGTDDLRESPVVEMVERLLGKGYDMRLYDRNVNLSSLIGTNRQFILKRIPHIARLMADTMDEVIEHGQILVIGNRSPEFKDLPGRLKQDQVLVDLVRAVENIKSNLNYKGMSW